MIPLYRWNRLVKEFPWLPQFEDDPRLLSDIKVSRLSEGTLLLKASRTRRISIVFKNESTSIHFDLSTVSFPPGIPWEAVVIEFAPPGGLPTIVIYLPPKMFTVEQLIKFAS